jgi:oligopeptide transport system ATP-binding protein
MSAADESLLAVEDLRTRFTTPDGIVAAVDGVSFTLKPGERLGVVGESGSGKSQLFLSLLGLLARNGSASGRALFGRRDLLALPRRDLNRVRGAEIAMVFQNPMSGLNPYLTIGRQLTEVLTTHKGMSEASAKLAASDMLARVGIADARPRLRLYPHEFSGGMRQRVMIAMALLCDPKLIIADEPTTALDVTIQAQILDLFRDLARSSGAALVLISHDLGIVAGLCDRVLVMYAGRIVENSPVETLFADPRHPYTRGLLASLPRPDAPARTMLPTIAGQPPNPHDLPSGCAFSPRCPSVMERCRSEQPPLFASAPGREAACFLEDVA